MTIYANFICGLQPEKNSSTKIKIFPGAISNGTYNPVDIIELRNAPVILDMETVGALGRDAGTLDDNTCWYIYALADPNGILPTTFIASQASSFGGVTIPVGYTVALLAKLPFAFIYRESMGIPDFRLRGWPSRNTMVYYSDWDVNGWDVVNANGTGAFVEVDLYSAGVNHWVPASARMVRIHYIFEGLTAGGELRFKLGAGSVKEQLIDYVPSGGKVVGLREDMTITSAGKFKYKAPVGTKVTLKCLGYMMSEV